MLAHFDESAANAEVANESEVILIANASNNDKTIYDFHCNSSGNRIRN